MGKFFITNKILLIFFLLFCGIRVLLFAENTQQESPILIISSYNPETSQTSKNISAFLDEYKSLGGILPVAIENMNCKTFSEANIWKNQMADILHKYSKASTPKMIILLGQEAWSAYISQEKNLIGQIPVICGMVSRNALILPGDSINLREWQPESLDVFEDIDHINIVAGYAYEYDIDKNIDLIKEFYPETKHIAFISDNTYGGVSMQALVRDEMKKFTDLDLILLDGRHESIYSMVDQLSKLPENTALLLGTWRVDMNEGYFMRNSIYTLKEANSRIPVFSLASIGLGSWVIGGYIPEYKSVGKEMAIQVDNYFKDKNSSKLKIEFIPNHYVFDIKLLKSIGYQIDKLPPNSDFVNLEKSFWEKYKYEIFGVSTAFITLLIGFLLALYFYVRTKRLKDDLMDSEAELRIAKERAEESSRLKSAFLANMSHEIRTPLNAIVGFSNVIASGGNTEEDLKKYFEVIQSNSDLLLHLINDILDISRLETDRIKFVLEDCDIVGLCSNVLATAEYARKTVATFVFNPPMESFILTTDVQRLQQILINLLSNASKFTKQGTITLDFKVEKDKNRVLFSVTDTGCGIPVDKRLIVFERFEKLNEYAQGTGLGLSICKLTINKLGGTIWVDPDYNDGARFIFTHPLDLINEDTAY